MKKNLLLLTMLIASAISAQTLDSSFGYHGKSANVLYAPIISITSSFLMPNNKLIVSGSQTDEYGIQTGAFMTSFSATGKPDPKFGEYGYVGISDLNSAFSTAQSADKIIMASWDPSQDGVYQQLVVSRYGTAGKADASFGTNGRRSYSAGKYYQYEYPTCINVDKAGNIYIGGVFDHQSKRVLITRLKADGNIDSSFKIIGEKTQKCRSLLVLDNGSLLAGFYNETTTDNFTASVVKFNQRGKIDSSFGNNGVVTLSNTVAAATSDVVYLQKAENGSFIVFYHKGYDFVFQKFKANGTPDNSFGNNSVANSENTFSRTFAIDENGNILQPLSNYVIKRYTNTGITDLSFGNNGFLTTDFNEFALDNTFGFFSQVVPVHGGFYVTGAYADVDLNYYVVAAKYKTGSANAVAVNEAAAQKTPLNGLAKMIVAPNPVQDVLKINNLPVKAHVIIVNAQGSVVKSVATTSNSMKLNVGDLSGGMYYVIVKETNQKERFIKL